MEVSQQHESFLLRQHNSSHDFPKIGWKLSWNYKIAMRSKYYSVCMDAHKTDMQP